MWEVSLPMDRISSPWTVSCAHLRQDLRDFAKSRPQGNWRLILGIWLIWACTAAGCGEKQVIRTAKSTPQASFMGPAFLYGTIGSMTQLRGYEPLLVSGYGLVVNLQNTGSADVPAYLRQWLINHMKKKGVGSARLGTRWMTPEKVLASPNTAVVLIQGMIPPGATKGTRFDVLVTALPQTQTTSLDGGQLWTAELSPRGDDPSMRYTRQLAKANGAIFVSPFDSSSQPSEVLRRQAVVLSGGVATSDRKLELILNQSSWQRSRMIADRINERFPKQPADRRDTAVPINDSRIELNLPRRFADHPEDLVQLINHLFTQRRPGFETDQAQRLADLLVTKPDWSPRIALAWRAMGKTVIPVIRRYYDHPSMPIRFTALEAGVHLEDEATSDALRQLAQSSDPEIRLRTARLLVHLPQSLRGAQTLHDLLDDENRRVRVEAYESLAEMNDPIIQRMAVGPQEAFKFVLDLVPSNKPLVYITQADLPRLVIFDPMLGFSGSQVVRLWDNRLMIRASATGDPLEIYHQTSGQTAGRTYRITPTLRDFVIFLSHQPSVQFPTDGLNLSYSQVTHVIHYLCQNQIIDSELRVETNSLAQAITDAQKRDATQPRPETASHETLSVEDDPLSEEVGVSPKQDTDR